MKPLVSVIIPVYNAEEYLADLLSDVTLQYYRNLEIIIVDDGSTDASLELAHDCADRDERVRVFSKENEGPAAARNFGLKVAKGEYIRFIDSDDRIPLDSIDLMMRAYSKMPEIDLLIGNYKCIPSHVYYEGANLGEGLISMENFVDIFILYVRTFYIGSVWNKLYRADIIRDNNIRFPTEHHWCEDFFFNMEYFLSCENVYMLYMKDGCYSYIFREESITSAVNKWKKARIEEVDNMRLEKCIELCGRYGAADRMKVEWQHRQLYGLMSRAAKMPDRQKGFRTFVYTVNQDGVNEYMELKDPEHKLPVWNMLRKALETGKYKKIFFYFWIKGKLAEFSIKYFPDLRRLFSKYIPIEW